MTICGNEGLNVRKSWTTWLLATFVVKARYFIPFDTTYTASVKQFRNGHIYPVEQHATFLHSQKGQPGARSSCLHRVQGRVWADSCILKTDSIWYALPKRTRKYCGAAVGENTTNFLLNLLTWQYKCVFILAMQLGRTKMSASILSSRWARW
jgi:hypothetical protein